MCKNICGDTDFMTVLLRIRFLLLGTLSLYQNLDVMALFCFNLHWVQMTLRLVLFIIRLNLSHQA